MSLAKTIRVFQNDTIRGSIDWDKPSNIILGRQRSESEEMFVLNATVDELRIAFARFRDTDYSRSHIQLSNLDDGRIRITNNSNSHLIVSVGQSAALGIGESVDQFLPTKISMGEFTFQIDRSLNSLAHQTRFHSDFEPQVASRESLLTGAVDVDDQHVSVGSLIDQLSSTNSVLQQVTTKDELYSRAIEAVKRLIDVDGVLIASGQDWSNQFSKDTIVPSTSVLYEVKQSRQVRWTPIDRTQTTKESQKGIDCFIAAPIVIPVENKEEVVAVLYAHRVLARQTANRQPLTKLHAQVFELIACSVAAGIVRIDQQAAHDKFQQFFSPSLAKQLIANDDLLQSREREVTILFCDIRRFSNISEKLGPTKTSKWVQDVLNGLSKCVLQNQGVLVDYIGDELMAMWGAPTDQADHPGLACKCANEMIELMPKISERWVKEIGEETKVGMGINTGMANVGNIGSKYKFKYGPLGDVVNRASRVQGLTKFLKVNAILTGTTAAKLDSGFKTRRLGKAKVVNMDESIDLFELCTGDERDDSHSKTQYEQALLDLEQGNLGAAAELLKSSLDFDAPDHPTLLMMNEVISRVINEKRSGDFEWEFKSK